MWLLPASRAMWKYLSWGVSLCLVAAWCSCWVSGCLHLGGVLYQGAWCIWSRVPMCGPAVHGYQGSNPEQ